MPDTVVTRSGLLDAFATYGRPKDAWLVGAEFERHLLTRDGTPLPYFGEPGVQWLLKRFQAEGWDPHFEGEHLIALHRGIANITLEPGGQFELSGAPHTRLQAIHDEAHSFITDIDRLTEGAEVHQGAIGFTPYAAIPDIPWVPKGRYVLMRSHLAKTGALAHHMMKGTCAVQASFDFADEAGAARKVQLSTLLGPLTTALFANSPYKDGRFCGYMTWRGHAWTQTDPSRTGFPEAAVDFTFERWIDYLLDVPMMFKQSADGEWLATNGQTFRSWLDSDTPPTWADWDLHMTSVFPEVRIKKQIEVRGADCVGLDLSMAFVALFKGIFYCDKGLNEATELAIRFGQEGTRGERFHAACEHGLQAQVGAKRFADWASELCHIATSSLQRCAPEDVHWLAPLTELAERGTSPAHLLLKQLGTEPEPAALLEAIHPLARLNLVG